MTRRAQADTFAGMKYLDSGARDPSQALGHWLEEVLRDGDVTEVRWQSGFFTADGLGFLAPTLERIRGEGGRVTALVGSNNGDTLRTDVARLLPLLGVPRAGALLGVVSFTGAFFHPKTCHLTRRNGTQVAYVGSANLTAAGVGSLHVEAGLTLDTGEGDDPAVLAPIAAGVDAWFANGGRPGLSVVDGPEAITRLSVEGVLAEQPPPRAQNEAGGGNEQTGVRRPRLRPLVRLPGWDGASQPAPRGPVGEEVEEEVEEEGDDEVAVTPAAVEWETVWRSKGLSERDLNIPTGGNTNPTGSIGLKKGDWDEDIEHRHNFRDEVFAALPWRKDTRTPTREVATAVFEVWIEDAFAGDTALSISHNTNTASTTYKQQNEMTHLRWGEAKSWVARKALLGAVLTLDRESEPAGVPKFRIRIDRM